MKILKRNNRKQEAKVYVFDIYTIIQITMVITSNLYQSVATAAVEQNSSNCGKIGTIPFISRLSKMLLETWTRVQIENI
jgi:hypothetical protein